VLLGIVQPRRIAEPFADCDLPTTIRSVQLAIAKSMGLTERVYRLRRQLRELSLTPKKRAQLTGELIQAAHEDACLSKIDPVALKSTQAVHSKRNRPH
jgi:hypothetical protein